MMSDQSCSSWQNLADLEIVEVLSCYAESKNCAVRASYTDEDGTKAQKRTAVVLLEKDPFRPADLAQWLKPTGGLKRVMHNDVYSVYKLPPPANVDVNKGVKMTVIAPASERHVEKYRSQPVHFVTETAEVYKRVTEPYVQELAVKDKLQWVHNLLEHKAETERIVFEDPHPADGFILAPDMKWDGGGVDNFYMQAVVNRRDLRTLRDLTGDHVPLLVNILRRCPAAINEKYPSVGRSRLRFYLHYPPSYYHLHVHVVNAGYNPPGVGQSVGQALLLQDVIENLKSDGSFYKKRTLYYGLKANHPLYEKFRQAELLDDN